MPRIEAGGSDRVNDNRKRQGPLRGLFLQWGAHSEQRSKIELLRYLHISSWPSYWPP